MELVVNGGAAAQAEFGAMPERTRKAMVRALNRGINAARTVLVSRIAKDTALKSKDVRDALKVRQATFNKPEARIATSLKRIPLIKFGARGPEPSRGRGRGVSYRVGGSGKQRVTNAFIATMGTGHRGVFARKGTGRLPIRELQGPSIGHVFAKYRPEARGIAQEFFDRNFDRELKFQASRG